MIYRVQHVTTYKYKQPVSFGNHAVHLTPRSQPHHRRLSSDLRIKPAPATLSERDDFFGNRITLFTIEEPHDVLEITASSMVELDGATAPWPDRSMPWEEVAATVRKEHDALTIEAYQFVFESTRIRPSHEFAAYAAPSFSSGRPFTEAVLDLTARINREFKFDHEATNVRTPPEEVLRKRRGVCQDFAQLQIACLRSLQLPARYVSGYLRTYPPPGKPRLVGADASHAWVSVFCPGAGWLDVDPTNNVVPSQSHVTLAWGRDYGDVSPVRGIILGGRDHTVHVGVDLAPAE
jgi:transglutaminase-like putative cysteine protease